MIRYTLSLVWILVCACQPAITTAQADQETEIEMIRPNTGTTFGIKTGWGQAGTLTTFNKTRQVTMQAEFPETGTFTAQFDKDGPLVTINDDPIMPEALVSWVVEGHIVTRRITVGDGASLSGVGQAVKVLMTDATTSTNLPGGPFTPTDYGVSVQVTRGERGASKQPPTLILHDIIPSATSLANRSTFGGGVFGLAAHSFTSIVVPQDAGAVSLFITGIGSSPPTLTAGQLLVTQELGVGAGGKLYDAFNYLDWVPLNPGVTDILVTNNSNTALTVTATLGIEG